MKKIFFLAVTAVLCAFGTVAAQQFPSVQIEDQEGGMVDTRTLIDGKTPVIISFWSTTCKPCIKELDAIVENMPDWLDEADFRVVAVSVDDSRSVARAKSLAAGRGWKSSITLLYDKNQDFKRAMNVNTTPHVFIFDKDGKMVYTHTSYLPGSEEELIDTIISLK